MHAKPSLFSLRGWRKLASLLMAAALLAGTAACSGSEADVTPTPSPTPIMTPAPPTPSPTVVPTATIEPSVSHTPRPTPVVSFPPLETDAAGAYKYPQVVADKSEALTGEPVYFKIVTSENVTKIQTVIDGETGKIYTEYETEGAFRIWRTTIHFTVGGTRKVQFKCTTTSGGTVKIPDSPVKIKVTFDYTAESTSASITKGKTVTFTLKTPDSIDYLCALVDGVNQNIKYTEPAVSEGGVKTWKVNITFFGLGDRLVTFEAYDGSSVAATFPDPGIKIVVKESA
jgi:hypothetical protein